MGENIVCSCSLFVQRVEYGGDIEGSSRLLYMDTHYRDFHILIRAHSIRNDQQHYNGKCNFNHIVDLSLTTSGFIVLLFILDIFIREKVIQLNDY